MNTPGIDITERKLNIANHPSRGQMATAILASMLSGERFGFTRRQAIKAIYMADLLLEQLEHSPQQIRKNLENNPEP